MSHDLIIILSFYVIPVPQRVKQQWFIAATLFLAAGQSVDLCVFHVFLKHVCGYVIRMPLGRLQLEVFQALLTGRRVLA